MTLDGFLVPVPPADRQRHGPLDLHGADPDEPRPAVVLVHGGPVAPGADPSPRESPTSVAYARLLAARGVVAVTFAHRLHDADHALLAADDLAEAVALTREHPAVDPGRIALWHFSMGGVLAASWLRDPPPWLRAIAWTYPVLAPGSDWTGDVPRFDCVAALGAAPGLPTLLVRVEHEQDVEFLAPAQAAFVRAARERGSALDVIEVPGAHHPFEFSDHTPDTRAAVRAALDWVAAAVTAAPGGPRDGRHR